MNSYLQNEKSVEHLQLQSWLYISVIWLWFSLKTVLYICVWSLVNVLWDLTLDVFNCFATDKISYIEI